MATQYFFDHTSLDGRSPSDRAHAAAYQGGFIGENIAAGHPTPEAVVTGWMASPGHCLNIMEPGYRYLGVGYYKVSGGQLNEYWTQNFGG